MDEAGVLLRKKESRLRWQYHLSIFRLLINIFTCFQHIYLYVSLIKVKQDLMQPISSYFACNAGQIPQNMPDSVG